jgi:hypothetical protein
MDWALDEIRSTSNSRSRDSRLWEAAGVDGAVPRGPQPSCAVRPAGLIIRSNQIFLLQRQDDFSIERDPGQPGYFDV